MKTTTICPICHSPTLTSKNFCKNCRYPIGVKNVNLFNSEELSVQLNFFHEIFAKSSKEKMPEKGIDRLYDELFSLNWLRPESALISFVEARMLFELKHKYFKYPTLDLGCGEGIFTSILFGAKINKNYDAYEAIDLKKLDPYDAYVKMPRDFFEKRSSPIGFGVDIKNNSISRARDLKIYDKAFVGDLRKLPLGDDSVWSVFSNMIEDIKTDDLPIVFKEISRVLKQGGYFIFTIPNENFRKSLFYCNKALHFKKLGDLEKYKLFSMFDRGRSEWESRPINFWGAIFRKASLRQISHTKYADKNVMQIWDTGLRPAFGELMKFRSELKQKNILREVKKLWTELIKKCFMEYAKEPRSPKGAFSIIVVQKI